MSNNKKNKIIAICVAALIISLTTISWCFIIKNKNDNKKINEEPKIEDSNIPTEETKISYYCDDDYTLNETKCTKTETINATESSKTCEFGTLKNNKCYNEGAAAMMTCPSGYSYNVVMDECENEAGEYAKELGYNCDIHAQDSTYTWVAEGSYCYIVEDPIITYTCPSGYQLSGNKCTRTITIDAKKKVE